MGDRALASGHDTIETVRRQLVTVPTAGPLKRPPPPPGGTGEPVRLPLHHQPITAPQRLKTAAGQGEAVASGNDTRH